MGTRREIFEEIDISSATATERKLRSRVYVGEAIRALITVNINTTVIIKNQMYLSKGSLKALYELSF